MEINSLILEDSKGQLEIKFALSIINRTWLDSMVKIISMLIALDLLTIFFVAVHGQSTTIAPWLSPSDCTWLLVIQ